MERNVRAIGIRRIDVNPPEPTNLTLRRRGDRYRCEPNRRGQGRVVRLSLVYLAILNLSNQALKINSYTMRKASLIIIGVLYFLFLAAKDRKSVV